MKLNFSAYYHTSFFIFFCFFQLKSEQNSVYFIHCCLCSTKESAGR